MIPSDDINVAKDIAFCRSCNISYSLSELALGADLTENLDVSNPPNGTWHRSEGNDVVIGASHRSFGAAAGALAIALFWNGIVSVFVVLAIAGTLANMGIAVPDWFPAPVMNKKPMSVGMTIFLWLFLTPFIAVGLAMIAAFLSALGGRTEVRINGSNGTVYTGIGRLGYSRHFDANSVTDVRIDEKRWRDSDGDSHRRASIVIETQEGKIIRFGSALKDERKKFVAGALRRGLLR